MSLNVTRCIIIVLDGVGCGALPDAVLYGDTGSNTLANLATAMGGLTLPYLQQLGLGNIIDIPGIDPVSCTQACFGKMQEQSAGKDTITGHWELAGIITATPFPTYENGFPKEVISTFERAIGSNILGNYAASGTVIIEELGKEHLSTKKPIVYTSADSVFQIAAHTDIIPLEQLYHWCMIARNQLIGNHRVARVIARPFTGTPGNFTRTSDRKDYSVVPPEPTIFDYVQSQGNTTLGIGKIYDIFAGKGITQSIHTESNMHGIAETINAIQHAQNHAIIMTNLVDYDMKYGHRNDIHGFYKALQEFDIALPDIIASLNTTDLLFITADHGCDPTSPGTDHSREYVPLLVFNKNIRQPISLGTRTSFSDIAQTIMHVFGYNQLQNGTSFHTIVG